MASVQAAPNLMTQAAISETYSVRLLTTSSLTTLCNSAPLYHTLLIPKLTFHQKYKQLKDQGVRQDDPEFIKCHNILQAVQKQQRFRQHQQAEHLKQQAQQQAHQAQQQQHAEETNGVNGM